MDGSISGSIRVVIGMHERADHSDPCREVHTVVRSIVHPHYSSVTIANDIALVELSTPSGYAPITLYNLATHVPATLEMPPTMLTVAGWGTTDPSRSRLPEAPLR
eukprot:4335422-Prymnesium_polylepis.2